MTRHDTDTKRDQDDVTNRRLWRLVGPIVVFALAVLGWAVVELVRTAEPQDLVLLGVLTALVALAQLQKIDIRVGATQINLSPVSAGVLICVAFGGSAVAVVTACLGETLARVVIGQWETKKLLFNVGKETLTAVAAGVAAVAVGLQPLFVGP